MAGRATLLANQQRHTGGLRGDRFLETSLPHRGGPLGTIVPLARAALPQTCDLSDDPARRAVLRLADLPAIKLRRARPQTA